MRPIDLDINMLRCSKKVVTEFLEKENLKWKISFTGTSPASIQTAVQAGMGLSILPMGALKEGFKKVPSQVEVILSGILNFLGCFQGCSRAHNRFPGHRHGTGSDYF